MVRISCAVTINAVNKIIRLNPEQRRFVSYVQGQEPVPRVREYFYFIDHQGMLFLDDSRMKNFTSCFKDKKFLKFFFDRLRINETDRYRDFPYLSLCGRERNFVRCDDYPFVFTHVIRKPLVKTDKVRHLENPQNKETTADFFCFAHAGDLLYIPFQPDRIFMSPSSGRVYHPAPEKAGGIGLVRSNLAIEFSKSFRFDNGEMKPPTHFFWGEEGHLLDTSWYKEAVERNRERNLFIRDDLVEKECLS